jgi:hypothetical protein
MGQIIAKMRNTTQGFSWWCPACEQGHPLPSKYGWTFDGNLEAPTFTPSFKHTGKQPINVDGVWTGEWVRDKDGKAVDWCCHYIITAGQVAYCSDCTHSLAGKTILMPDLPPHLRDIEILGK